MYTKPYSRAEIERIARLSAFLALAQDPPAKVWSLDKANVLATSRLWRKTVTALFEKEFPQLQLEHQLIDSAAMLMVKSPRTLNGIVMTSNLFGDIISDEASVIPGSIGLLPSASLGGLPDGKSKCNGIYEPIHGKFSLFPVSTRKAFPLYLLGLTWRHLHLLVTLPQMTDFGITGSAPDISGKGIVNPVGTILSVAMMFRYSLGLPNEAKAVEQAVKNAIDNGTWTKDLGGNTSTKDMGDAIVAELEKILKK